MKSINRLEYLLAFVTFVFAVIIFISLLPRNVLANGDFDLCGNNHEFTVDFLIDGCQFKANGATPYFILTPGFQRILATPDGAEEPEMSIETVLCKTKTINLDGRLIKTRVYEERALECEEGECETVEISLNWFAICKQTGDVYYFGEESKDCEYGFDENDECCNEEDVCGQETTGGSWEAGVNGAMPGIMMPGTFLLGAKYFQEIALSDDAADRGENVAMGLTAPNPDGGDDFEGCVMVHDTNPVEGECGDDDAKTYCPGVGLVQDQDMVLVDYGFAGCINYLPEDDED